MHPALPALHLCFPWCQFFHAPQGIHDFSQRVPFLLAHGICHLIGHTHDDDNCHAAMEAEEARLLQALHDARVCRPPKDFQFWARVIKRRSGRSKIKKPVGADRTVTGGDM